MLKQLTCFLLYLRVKKKLWKTKKNSLKLSEKLIYALDDNCYSKFWEASVKNCTFYLSTSSVKTQLCHQRELIFQVTKPHPCSCISVSTAIQQQLSDVYMTVMRCDMERCQAILWRDWKINFPVTIEEYNLNKSQFFLDINFTRRTNHSHDEKL